MALSPRPSAQSPRAGGTLFSQMEASNQDKVTYVFSPVVVETVFPTFIILSWAAPRPVYVGGSNGSALEPKGHSYLSGWYYQVSWLCHGEASSVPMNITTPLQHVVIPREMGETKIALQIICVPKTTGSAPQVGTVVSATPTPSQSASPHRGAVGMLGVTSSTTTTVLSRIVWSRVIDLAIDDDALAANIQAMYVRPDSDAPMDKRNPFIFRSAADILNSPVLLDLYLLTAASPVGCLPALPDVLSMLMYLGTRPLSNPLTSTVHDTSSLLAASSPQSPMLTGDYTKTDKLAGSSTSPQPEGSTSAAGLTAEIKEALNQRQVRKALREARREARLQRRHFHRPVLLGQGVLKGVSFMGMRCVVPVLDEDGNPTAQHRRVYYMVCLDDLQSSLSTSSNSALILRDVFNNTTEHSTDEEAEDIDIKTAGHNPALSPRRGGAVGSAAPKHKATAVLRLSNLWELLEDDPTSTIIFSGQRSKSAHMCGHILIGSLLGQAKLAKAAPAVSSSHTNTTAASPGLVPSLKLSTPDPKATSSAAPTPFSAASSDTVLDACKRIFSVVFDGPLEEYFSKQNIAMSGTAKYAPQFVSVSTAGLSEEERTRISLSATVGALAAGPTGMPVALATAVTTTSGVPLHNTNLLVPVVPEGGATAGPTLFANGELSAINTIAEFGSDGSSFLGLHTHTAMQHQFAARVAREDSGVPPGNVPLGGPSGLPPATFVSAPVGLLAYLSAPTSESAAMAAVVVPSSLKPQPYGGHLSSVIYNSPDCSMQPLAATANTFMVSGGAIGSLTMYNETALVDVASAALQISCDGAMSLLSPTLTSVEATVVDSVFVHITLRGNCLGMRPLLTVQCESPIPSPPIEPRLLIVSTHCIVAEFRLEKVYPLLPCIPRCSLSLVISTSFGVQAANGIDLLVPGEYLEIAPELSVGNAERGWITTSSISDLISGAILVEPFFTTINDRDLSSGITHKQLTSLEAVVEAINETSSKNNGLFSRISNAASRVTGKRQLTLSAGGKSDHVSRMLSDHIRSGRDARVLTSQLMPWRTKVQTVFPWANKPLQYEQKVRLFYSLFAEMEQCSVSLASNDGIQGVGGYSDVTKASVGAEVSEQIANSGYQGPKDVTFLSNMPTLANNNFSEPSLSATQPTSGSGGNAPPTGAATTANFNTLQASRDRTSTSRALPIPYMESVINAEALRLCRRAQPDLYTQSIVFEAGFRPTLPTPSKFGPYDNLCALMSFDQFYAFMFPILNAHRIFNDISSEALLADVATLWCIVLVHHLRMAYLLSRHLIVVGQPKVGSSTLCNAAKICRSNVLGKSLFQNGGGVAGEAILSKEQPQMAFTGLREQTVSIKEIKRLDDLLTTSCQGINMTIAVLAEWTDINSDNFHTAVIKPMKIKMNKSYSRAVLVITKLDEALKQYAEEILVGQNSGKGRKSSKPPSEVPTAKDQPPPADLPLSLAYRDQRVSASGGASPNSDPTFLTQRVWAERIVADLCAYLEQLVAGDAIISTWRAPPPDTNNEAPSSSNTSFNGLGSGLSTTHVSNGRLSHSIFKICLSSSRVHIESAMNTLFLANAIPSEVLEAAAVDCNTRHSPKEERGSSVVSALCTHVVAVLTDISAEQMKWLVS